MCQPPTVPVCANLCTSPSFHLSSLSSIPVSSNYVFIVKAYDTYICFSNSKLTMLVNNLNFKDWLFSLMLIGFPQMSEAPRLSINVREWRTRLDSVRRQLVWGSLILNVCYLERFFFEWEGWLGVVREVGKAFLEAGIPSVVKISKMSLRRFNPKYRFLTPSFWGLGWGQSGTIWSPA